MPVTPEHLDGLARSLGISTRYRDIWGAEQTISDATLRSLVRSMGVDLEAQAGLQDALDDLSRRRRRLLPPAVVVRRAAEQPLGPFRSVCPLSTLPYSLQARIREEHGARHQCDIVLSPPENIVPLETYGGQPTADSNDEPWVAVDWYLPADLDLPLGYHRLVLATCDSHGHRIRAEAVLIVVPERCYEPEGCTHPQWGPLVQLYGVSGRRETGIGDFEALYQLVDLTSQLGGQFVGVSPLHATFPHDPTKCSPYSASSRIFLNVSFLDLPAIAEFRGSDRARSLWQETKGRRRALSDQPLVDYVEVAAIKRPILEALYATFQATHRKNQSRRYRAFCRFVKEEGDPLWLHAVFEALQEHFSKLPAAPTTWQHWPEVYRDPQSIAVRLFAESHADRVEFFAYLQWLADSQLARASRRAAQKGLSLGLYADLAVGADRSGAEAWSSQRVLAMNASVGAPPDDFSPKGQDWGLPPLQPHQLLEAAYAPLILLLSKAMRHAGVLRIDHVMGLRRLFWIPVGKSAAEGAYVDYPFDDLLGIVALESHRQRCIVIGEDLGTVPDEVRQKMASRGILAYRPFVFQRGPDGSMLPPHAYPEDAIVCCSTHDLPTLSGFFTERDIDLRESLSLFVQHSQANEQREDRRAQRKAILDALRDHGLLEGWPTPDSTDVAKLIEGQAAPDDRLRLAVHAFLLDTPCKLVGVQLEDLLGVSDQANLPGTVDQHPNWKRRLPLGLRAIAEHPAVVAFGDIAKSRRSGSA